MAVLRILMVEPFPIPYFAPLHRALAARPDVELTVAYLSLSTISSEYRDPGFDRALTWSPELLDGYSWLDWSTATTSWSQLLRQVDVVFLSTYRMRPFALLLALSRLRGVPLVLASDAIDLTPQPNSRVKPRLLRRAVANLTVRLTAGLNATSARGVDFYRSVARRHADRVHLVPYVADGELFVPQSGSLRAAARRELGIAPDSFVCGFVGKLIERKRPLDLLRVVAAVPSLTGLFVGSGPLQPDLQDAAAKMGVADRVIFAGFHDQRSLPRAYSAMDVSILPSSLEPFGLVVHESQLCGVPCVCSTACGAFDDLVAPVAGWLGYPPGQIDDAARIIRRLMNPEERRQVGERAREVAQCWDSARQAEAFLDACVAAHSRDVVVR